MASGGREFGRACASTEPISNSRLGSAEPADVRRPVRGNRKGEVEGAALAELALRPDPALVPQHDELGDVQTEPHAAAIVRAKLMEPLEDRFELVGGDPRPGIADTES